MSWQASRRAVAPPAAALAGALLLAACQPPARPAVVPQAPAGGAPWRLQHDLDEILAAPPLSRGSWGALVRSLDRGDTLYASHADARLLPASTLKILTLAAAGERLGWDYRFETRLLAVGPIADGALQGDLFVIGGGDPTILDRDGSGRRLFGEWAAALQAAGIRTIRGRIVGDDRAFRETGPGSGWAWDDLVAGYASPVTALQYNDNVAGLLISPGAAPGAQAAVAVDPADTGLLVDNRVVTAAAGGTAAISVERLPGSARLIVAGTVPLGGTPVPRTVSVDAPTRFFVSSLRRVLVGAGIVVEGTAAGVDELDAPPPATEVHPILVHRSAPLAEVAVRLMKQSQNLHAETLLFAMGQAAGEPTAAGGARAVRRVLDAWGLPPDAVTLADGSGLSRYNLITAGLLVDVLTRVAGDAGARRVFEEALPIGGYDGTLDDRFRGSPAEGRVLAKTGSMSGVRALAGYMTTAAGERLVFAFLGNNFEGPGSAADDAIDACVVRLTGFARGSP